MKKVILISFLLLIIGACGGKNTNSSSQNLEWKQVQRKVIDQFFNEKRAGKDGAQQFCNHRALDDISNVTNWTIVDDEYVSERVGHYDVKVQSKDEKGAFYYTVWTFVLFQEEEEKYIYCIDKVTPAASEKPE